MERKTITGMNNEKRIGILHGASVLVIILCFMVTPVMGVIKTENWTPLGPLPPNYLPDQFKPSEPVPVPDYANLTPAERKIEPDLRDLVAVQKLSNEVENINVVNLKKNKKLYKPGNVVTINGLSIWTSPDLVWLQIHVFPGNSTHILDPYIYELNARGEEWSSLSAWVDVTKIYDIASLPEVQSVDTVTYAFYSTRSQDTQRNLT